jgi:hypothetical protein
MSDTSSTPINDHVVEIRYKANPRVLDHRGTWAEMVSEHMALPHWKIIENRIDIFTKDRELHAFVGFKNSGLTALNTPTKNYFSDKAIKLLRFVFTLQDFGDPIHVDRIGVRSRFCSPYLGTFEELRDRYSTKFLRITEEGINAIGKKIKLIDIGGPLNFADKFGNFNTQSGPMTAKQFNDFFNQSEDFPDVGLYFDIDYFVRPETKINSKEIITTVKNFSSEAWDRHERIRDLILGD